MVRWEPEVFFLSYGVLDWMLGGYPHCLESGALVPNLQCLCRCLLEECFLDVLQGPWQPLPPSLSPALSGLSAGDPVLNRE